MQGTDLWPEQCPKLPPATGKVYSRRRVRPASANEHTECPSTSTAAAPACTTPALTPRTVTQPAAVRRPLTQLHLDLGQSNFTCVTCRVCGMTYAPGQEEDEKMHRTYHSSALQGVRYQGWQNERVIWRDSGQGRIVLVLPSDPAQQQKKVQELYAFLETQLGLSSGWLQSSHSKVLMCVSNNKRIIGCLVAEAVSTAYPCVPSLTAQAMDESEHPWSPRALHDQQRRHQRGDSRGGRAQQGRLQGRLEVDETQPHAAACGVRVVWVSAECRRQGVATGLLNAARANCIPGYIVPRHELAFSQPTEAGRHLAAKYTGTDTFLVYRCKALAQVTAK
ncbi:hypothetical protein WJX73_002728 [Symbiochloris irregularis]|uniref:Uncharacterized protein n=1 Tax=Symbiochloris irregularis TaxID=706552 RepID=A0AAW1P897_9CHLO